MTDTVARCVPLDRPGSTPNLRHALSGPAPVSAPVSQAHLFRANRRLFHLHSPGTQILKSVQLFQVTTAIFQLRPGFVTRKSACECEI